MMNLLVRLAAVSFVAGAGLEFALQVSGYNKILEESAERKRLQAELEEKDVEKRMIQKYGQDKVTEMTRNANNTTSSDKVT